MRQQLSATLERTLIADAAIIKEASAAIEVMKMQTGFCASLMQIADDQGLRVDVRQAALAQLQNTVRSRWSPHPTSKSPEIPAQDKQVVRQHIMVALIRCNLDSKFLSIYKNIIRLIIETDYATWLPIQEILAALKKGVEDHATDANTVPSVLHFVMAVVKAFQKEMGQARPYLDVVVERVFPALLELIKIYPLPQYIFLIVKTYWKAIIMDMGNVSKQFSLTWMPLICNIINQSSPSFQDGKSHIQPKKGSPEFYYFHTKKWAYRIVMKFSQRHANPGYKKEYKEYSNLWYSSFGQGFINAIISQVKKPATAKARYFSFKCLVYIAQAKPAMIQPRAREIMFEILPSFMMLTPADQELAKEDPVEFLRKEQDPVQNFMNFKMAATDLWMGLCSIGTSSVKKKQTVGKLTLEGMQFLNAKLASPNLLQKQMAMFIICRLRTSIMEIEQVKQVLPTLIDRYVISQLNNPQMFLRARAVQLFTDYGYIQFPDKSVLKRAVEGIYSILMNDAHTIVKVKAACSFNCILKHSEAIEWVKPYLDDILTIYIKLLDKYDLENLVLSLEGIISHFSDQISPFAIKLVQHLCTIFMKYVKIDMQKIEDKDYDGEVEMAASGCLQAISGIIDSPIPNEVLPQLQQFIVPVISYAFTEQGVDYIGDVLNFLGTYLYKSSTISPNLWFFYPVIIYNIIGLDPSIDTTKLPLMNSIQPEIFSYLKGAGDTEALDDAVICIRNYIFKAKDVIMEQSDFFGNNLIMLVFKLADAAYKPSQQPEFDSDEPKASATALMVYLLENIKQVGTLIPLIWQIAKRNFQNSDSSYLTVINLQLVSLCLYVAPKITLDLMETNALLEKYIKEVEEKAGKFEDEWQKQRIVLGLTALLKQNTHSQAVRAASPTILRSLVKQIQTIYEIRKSAETNNQAEEAKGGEAAGETFADEEDDSEDDLGDEMFWDEAHDDNYETDLDAVDEIIYFEEAVKELQATNPTLHTQLFAAYKPEQLAELKKWIEESKAEFNQRLDDIKNNPAPNIKS